MMYQLFIHNFFPYWKPEFSMIYFSCLVLQSCAKSEREDSVCNRYH